MVEIAKAKLANAKVAKVTFSNATFAKTNVSVGDLLTLHLLK